MSVSGIGTDASYLTSLFNTTTDASSTTPDFATDFEAIDSNATGVITKAEFEQATAESKYFNVLPPDAKPPLDLHKAIMEKYRPDMQKHYLNKTVKFQ